MYCDEFEVSQLLCRANFVYFYSPYQLIFIFRFVHLFSVLEEQAITQKAGRTLSAVFPPDAENQSVTRGEIELTTTDITSSLQSSMIQDMQKEIDSLKEGMKLLMQAASTMNSKENAALSGGQKKKKRKKKTKQKLSQGVQIHVDETTGKRYSYNPATNTTKWL